MKTMMPIAAVTAALLLLAGCAKQTIPDTDNRQQSNIQHPITLAAPVANVFTEFSFDFFNHLQSETQTDKDIFVSPLSLHIALGMLVNGAQGSTRTEIMKALKAENLSQEALNEAYHTLLEEMPKADPLVQLALANAIFYKNNVEVETPFLNTMAQTFNAQITGLPFQPGDQEIINKWASDHTNGKITKVLDQINPDLIMLLMNALYFKGDWRSKFDKAKTKDQPFYRQDGGQTSVKMMNHKDTFQLASGEQFTALQMPYGNGQFRATLLLPNEGIPIAEIYKSLDKTKWEQLQQSFKTQTVELGLPKFKLEQEFELNNTLQKMGMIKAFDQNATFEPIAPLKPLFVGFVKQNTFAAVDEEGTEAAAVTTIGMVTTSLPAGPPRFICNKPFGLIISEKSSNTILFMGRIMDPQQ